MRYHISFDIDFKRNPFKGRYIAVEGNDGSGKSTQVEQLARYFQEKGNTVLPTHEPTREGHIGKLIHEVLQAKVKIPSVSLQYLFSADRAVHYATKVIPALEDGAIVISDRCFWSAVPYGLVDREALDYTNEGYVLLVAQGLLSMYHQFIVPDATFYLDVSVESAMKRLSSMDKSQEIYERREVLENIERGYKWLIKQFPKEFVVIEAEESVEEVTEAIINRLLKLLK